MLEKIKDTIDVTGETIGKLMVTIALYEHDGKTEQAAALRQNVKSLEDQIANMVKIYRSKEKELLDKP